MAMHHLTVSGARSEERGGGTTHALHARHPHQAGDRRQRQETGDRRQETEAETGDQEERAAASERTSKQEKQRSVAVRLYVLAAGVRSAITITARLTGLSVPVRALRT